MRPGGMNDDSCVEGLENFSVVQTLRGQGDEGVRRVASSRRVFLIGQVVYFLCCLVGLVCVDCARRVIRSQRAPLSVCLSERCNLPGTCHDSEKNPRGRSSGNVWPDAHSCTVMRTPLGMQESRAFMRPVLGCITCAMEA